MHNPMNRNPEENRPLDPFAAAEAPEMASETRCRRSNILWSTSSPRLS